MTYFIFNCTVTIKAKTEKEAYEKILCQAIKTDFDIGGFNLLEKTK